MRNANMGGFDVGTRQADDFYSTPSWAIEELLKREAFPSPIWECAAGDGAISRVLEKSGYTVVSSDIRQGAGVYGEGGINFFFESRACMSIITNPPFKSFQNFALRSIGLAEKVALFARLQILEGRTRYKEIFSRFPPKKIYVFCRRVNCLKNGDAVGAGTIAFCWLVWERGFNGKPTVEWIL